MIKRIYSYLPGIVLLTLCAILSFFIYEDYGVSWDEPAQRNIGIVSYEYITENNRTLDTYIERDHGTGFELILIFIEHNLHLDDPKDIYEMRHIASHLFFLVSCFFGYILCYRLFRNNVIACIGFLMFVFHPRIFAHSFFNTKDLPFLSAFLIALTVCQLAFDKDRPYLYLLAGAAVGYASSIRILGIILACIIIPLMLIDLCRAMYKKAHIRRSASSFVLFIVGYCLTLFISFPSLWAQPFVSFAEVFQSLSHFRWGSLVLLDGQFYRAAELPWTYLPIWFSNTMPVVWLFIGGVSVLWLIGSIIKRPGLFFKNARERNFLVYLGCFLLPVLSTIIMKSVVYDGWRHVYFIYPPFVLIVLYAVDKLYAHKKARIALVGMLSVQFIAVGYFMVKYHPFQQVYFNELVPHKAEFLRYNYDLDYWGASCKQGLEYVLAQDKRENIKLASAADGAPLSNNIDILPVNERRRISMAYDLNDADYFFTNFRYDPHDLPFPHVFYEVRVLNSTILRVYKMR